MKLSETKRLAILRTDAVREDLEIVHGDYPQMFERVLSAVDPSLEFVSMDARQPLPEEVDCDIYLITGSRHSVYDNLPWIPGLVNFLKRVLAADRKVMGICFGHQLMAHFFGGEVAPAAQGWGVGIRTARVINEHPWMQVDGSGCIPEQVKLLCSHRDQVQRLPDGADVYMGSNFCPVGGFTLGDQVITVQGHPEFSHAYVDALITQRRELLGEDVFRSGRASLSQAAEGELVVAWMLNFVQQQSARPPARNPEKKPAGNKLGGEGAGRE